MSVRSVHVQGLHHGKAPIPSAARSGPLVTSSRVFGLDPESGKLGLDPAAQVALVFSNIRAIMNAAGGQETDVARVSFFVNDNQVRPLIDDEWVSMFPHEDRRPARHIDVVELRAPLVVQAEFTAYIEGDPA